MKGSDKIVKLLSLAGLVAVLAFTTSCKKEKQIDLNPGLNVANDIIIAQRPVLFAVKMIVRAANDTGLQQTYHTAFEGASVTYNPGQNRYSFYFFGTGPDGVARAGSIDADLFGDLSVAGTMVRVTFHNYFEDGMNINAGDSLMSGGISGNNLTFSNVVSGGIILKDTIGTIHFNANLEYRVPAAPWSSIPSALLSAWGTISGTSSKGFPFTSVITEPLVYPLYSQTCAWVRQGSFRFSISDTGSVAGTIIFPSLSSCNDSVYYDLTGTTYRWRMELNYLNH
jgi:hypothetical protein